MKDSTAIALFILATVFCLTLNPMVALAAFVAVKLLTN